MTLFLSVWLVLILIMTIVWVFYLTSKNPGIIDVAWAGVIVLAGFVFVFAQILSLHNTLVLLVLLLWGLRLSGYLYYTRVRPGHVDKRYVEISNKWKVPKAIGFWLNYQLQAILAMIIALPFLFLGSSQATISWWTILCLLISLVGIIGESIADWQLYRCKQTQPGKLCITGLWRWSRHPNYFFEWLVWIGFALVAIHSLLSILALLSPICLYLIFTKLTGPITERSSLASRGEEYRQYQRTTSMFFLARSKNSEK